MNYHSSSKTSRDMSKNKHDSIELEKSTSLSGTLSSFGKDTIQKVGEGFSDVGKGIFEQLLNNYDSSMEKAAEQDAQKQEEAPKQGTFRMEGGNLFNYRNIEEERQMSEIKQLLEQIKKEVDAIRKADKALMSEVNEIDNLTIETLTEKPGIYHIRFLEVVLQVLELMRSKISESGMWMQAMMSKKAKRGSAFAANSKKKGTQYSMSQELSNARSIQ